MTNEEKWEQKFQSLTFTDDFVFGTVLMRNTDLCKELLKLILGRNIGKIENVERQKDLKGSYDGKGIRLDAYMEDESTAYDVEMQVLSVHDLPERTRYYQSRVDAALLAKGCDYRSLKKSYIIFICMYDPFGQGLPVYTFSNICEEDHSIILEDGAKRVMVNAGGSIKKEQIKITDPALFELFYYLQTNAAENSFTRTIKKKVMEVISEDEWRREYMDFEIKIREREELAEQRGLRRGLQKGMQQGMKEGLQLANQRAIDNLIIIGAEPDKILSMYPEEREYILAKTKEMAVTTVSDEG